MRWTLEDVNVVDGTGRLPFPGRITIEDDKIVAIEQRSGRSKTGLTVTPGFIDMHSHSDLPLYIDGRAVNKVSQGITTEVIGQCGLSGAPLFGYMIDEVGRYFHRFGRDVPFRSMKEYRKGMAGQIAVNVVALIGHGTLRRGIRGEESRPSTAGEIAQMQEAIQVSMHEGAWGLSTGLIYAPGCFTPTDEVIAMAKAIAPSAGIYFTHLRNEGNMLIEAVDEAIEICRSAQVRLQLSHHN